MRVAVIDPSNFTLPYDLALCRGLASVGHEVHMIGRPPDVDEAWPDNAVAFHRLFYRGLDRLKTLPRPLFLSIKGISHAQGMLHLRRTLMGLRPDIIHVQWFPIPLMDRMMLPALRSLAPLVLTMHDTEPFNGNPSSAVQRLGAAGMPGLCDRVIVHTRLGAQRLEAMGAAADRVAVVPHGPLGKPPAALEDASRLAGPSALPVFLTIGKIKPYKGTDVFIEAVARLPAELRACAHFVVAGKPYMDMAPLFERVRRLGIEQAVRFDLRFLDDMEMERAMVEAAVLVFPYREIEASGVLSMALGRGRAIVASAVGGFAETLTMDHDALLVPPGDPAALASAMERLIRQPEERERLAAADRARQLPNWSVIARQTTDLYAAVRRDWLAHRAAA